MSHSGSVQRLGIRARVPGPQIEITTTVSESAPGKFFRRIAMQKHLLAIIVGLGLTASAVYLLIATPVAASQSHQSSNVFESKGKSKLEDPQEMSRQVLV